jgi:hypothetical protein
MRLFDAILGGLGTLGATYGMVVKKILKKIWFYELP